MTTKPRKVWVGPIKGEGDEAGRAKRSAGVTRWQANLAANPGPGRRAARLALAAGEIVEANLAKADADPGRRPAAAISVRHLALGAGVAVRTAHEWRRWATEAGWLVRVRPADYTQRVPVGTPTGRWRRTIPADMFVPSYPLGYRRPREAPVAAPADLTIRERLLDALSAEPASASGLAARIGASRPATWRALRAMGEVGEAIASQGGWAAGVRPHRRKALSVQIDVQRAAWEAYLEEWEAAQRAAEGG
ncbi:MAG: hypothetical protein ACRDYD_01315 [Acidimicrobiales bacterium]